MARYSGGARSASAGSTTLPLMSLYNSATTNGRIKEIGVFNTTSTAVAVKLARFSTAGTQGAGLTETTQDAVAPASACTLVNTHTVAPTAIDLGYNTQIGPAVGAGVIWTFEGLATGLAGTGVGIGVLIATGTGQICDIYFVWEE